MPIKAEYLVVDSGGFIKNDLGGLHSMADHIVTLHEVVSELRDKDVRARLRNTPLELDYRTPSSQAMRAVSDFARKTGDFASLSAVDLRVIAVAYDMEVAMSGSSHLKTEPTIKKTTEFYHPKENKDHSGNDSKLPGFFDGEEEDNCQPVTTSENYDQFNFWREPVADLGDFEEATVDESSGVPGELLEDLNRYLLRKPFLAGYEVSVADFAVFNLVGQADIDEDRHENIVRWSRNVRTHEPMNTEDVNISKLLDFVKNGDDFTAEEIEYYVPGTYEDSSEDPGYDSDQENDEEDEEEDDEEGWITPSNLKMKKAVITGAGDDLAPQEVRVALMTTDFAMQNVCKQMGLHIIGTNGLLIKETKTWILRCYGCFNTTPRMDKKFCPKCGNQTLKRVSVTLNEDGSQRIHISTRRPINTKGKKFNLPAPRGGKHAWNPRLTEDQREPQQRLSKKAIARNNPMGEDYLAGGSPFLTHDVTSKSAMLGLSGANKGNAPPPGFYWSQRNPNSVRKNTGNRKKY